MSYFANPRILYAYVSHVYISDDIPVDALSFMLMLFSNCTVFIRVEVSSGFSVDWVTQPDRVCSIVSMDS